MATGAELMGPSDPEAIVNCDLLEGHVVIVSIGADTSGSLGR
jgi:hypothetical protein